MGMVVNGPLLAQVIALDYQPLIELAVTAGADVNAADESGNTPLVLASGNRDWELVERLAQAGAGLNVPGQGGVTALMVAAAHGHLVAVKKLVEKGASPDATDVHGRTALHCAIATGRADVVAYLLEKITALPGPCEDGDRPAQYALHGGNWKIVEQLLNRTEEPLPWQSASRKWLADALRIRDAARVRLLLSRHEGAPTPEGREQPLLGYLLARGDLAQFQLLLDCGADPNTSLETPAEQEFLDVVQAKTVRQYLESEPGMNILMLAAGLGNQQAVASLLLKGASRGAATQSKHRLVPLYFAAWAESAGCLQLLVGNAPRPEDLRIDVSLGNQRAALVKGGVPVFTTAISSGRPGFSTPAGQFVVTDKRSHHISTIYKVKMPFFMRLSCRDFGLHQGQVPDYPASHGCIRLPTEAARKLFRDVPIGTLVTIAN